MSSASIRAQGDEQLPAYTRSANAHSVPSLVRSHTTTTGHPSRFLPDDDDDENAFPVAAQTNQRRDSIMEAPPVYTPFDELARAFSIAGSVINTISAGKIERPHYQLKKQSSKSGKLWRLQIRRLLPSESRRLSISTTSSVDFDVDTMLYEAENIGALYAFRKQQIHIRGRKAGTLQGHIELNPQGKEGFDYRHCTQPASKHWSREENIRKMHKWGYHADDEWEKRLLFTCRMTGRDGTMEWRYKDELLDTVSVVAYEVNGELVLQKQVPERIRDVLVTCWAVKNWVTKKLESETPLDVKLVRARTIG